MAIHMFFKKVFDGPIAVSHFAGEAGDRRDGSAHSVGGRRHELGEPASALRDNVVNKEVLD